MSIQSNPPARLATQPPRRRIWNRPARVVAVFLAFGFLAQFGARSVDFPVSPRERTSFDANWLFIKGDPSGSAAKLDYATLKPWLLASSMERSLSAVVSTRPEGNPGEGVAYTQPGCDDRQWRKVTLPHDWGIEAPFKQENPGDTGKLEWWGVGWYRKHFQLPAAPAGTRFYLEVDGAMSYASVWLNGQFVGGWPYGYSSWQVDLTSYLKPGAENVIAIRLENPAHSSRWYPGGGLYRNVWLVKTAPIHIAHWGTFLITPEVNRTAATLNLKVDVDNDLPSAAQVTLLTDVYELDGRGIKVGRPVVSWKPSDLNIGPGGTGTIWFTNTMPGPKLWSLKRPARYVAVTTVEAEGKIVDSYETPFGVRKVEFTADTGLLINGERVAVNGVCDHHDLGALGSAINVRALERQIELLQEMGCNAIRTSHNPPAPELLDLCDRLGMVVMDEAFDCWVRGKTKNDYHLLFPDWHEKDLRALVHRDRNHPCVILWSIGNEVLEQGSPAGHKVAAELAAIVRSEDLTRPVTAGCNDGRAGFNGFQKQVDVFGYNYKPFEYGKVREANPDLPLFGSETASCVSSRGEYFFPVSNDKSQGRANFQVSSYDLYAPPWATPPDTEFHGQDQFPFVAGEFVWTGFDYLGEPTPYNADTSNLLNFTDPAQQAQFDQQLKALGKIQVPSRSSYFGILDLAGFKKDRFYLYQARWRSDLRMVHILPHWNWPERVGQVTPVHVYTSGDSVELFLNGRSLGRKKRGPYDYRLRWDDVVYQPGELRAVASKGGTRWAEEVVRTTAAASKLLIEPDRRTVQADGKDLCFVTTTVADWNGRQVPRSKNHITFSVDGPAQIVAVDNGDATSFEPFQAKQHDAYNGLCLVILRSTGTPGAIGLKATSPGLKPAEVKILSK